MLRLNRLELQGFGPFADNQVVNFPSGSGVVVIYGENMRGKTTLLNAIRYAFFGRVLGRGRQDRKIHGLSNRELAARGQFGFSVTLAFDFDGESYELYRAHEPRVSEPASDADYSGEVLLHRGRTILNQQDRDRALAQVFPWDISRFFLFDGELLQEYEELIINESEAGPQISSAIERILGVPILKVGRRHLTELANEADSQAADEASRHRDTEALGTALQQAITIRTAHQEELTRLSDTLAERQREKTELEARLADDRRAVDLMSRRQDALAAAEEAAKLQADRRSDLKKVMGDAWRTILLGPVKEARTAATNAIGGGIDAVVLDLRNRALAAGACEVCEQSVGPEVRPRLEASTENASLPGVGEAVSVMRSLDGFREVDVAGEVRQLVRQVQELAVEEQHQIEEARDLLSALADTDQSSVRSTQALWAEVVEQIGVLRRGVEEQRATLEKQESRVEQLRRKLHNSQTGDLNALETRAKVLRGAAGVFEVAVEVYKSELRDRVQASASRLFLAMSTEKTDYAGLQINEDYGLTILHQDGRPEDARSAGAEHIVALALMGALQQNAPLRGPIVMDSPFGRLDEGHTSNVLCGLHQMADQVVLLVYEAEVGREAARALLGSRLAAEYELRKINSRRTEIVEVRR